MSKAFLITLCLVVAIAASEGCQHQWYCQLVCTSSGCRIECGWIINCGKRDVVELVHDDSLIENSPSSKEQSHTFPVALPNKFSEYDTNKDDHITYLEYKKAMPPARNKDLREGFQLLDKNGDGKISCSEFLRSRNEMYYGGKKLSCM